MTIKELLTKKDEKAYVQCGNKKLFVENGTYCVRSKTYRSGYTIDEYTGEDENEAIRILFQE